MIEIKNLHKQFSENIVIDNLNLSVNCGEIVCLVGKNGSGKSTLIRLISGLLKPDRGEIHLSSKNIGVLLGGDVNLYTNLTALEIINYFGKLHNLTANEINKQIDTLNKILDFKDFLSKKSSTLSRGMRQKIALVIALIHDPDILLLDEPSTGLDLEASNDIINIIKHLKNNNKTILIATHNIFEISDLSDSIAFLYKGKICQKVKTNSFFSECLPNEKNDNIIKAMRGETIC